MAELNRWGREVWRSLGRLGEVELTAPGGTRYAVGDRVVALAPAAGGQVVTSETGTVIALDRTTMSLAVRMDDGGAVHTLDATEIAAGRLAHAYAVTVHRSQGSTVERAHCLEDGGGRELAYVKMSRAKERSTVYVVADSVDLAADDLAWEWKSQRRLRWAIDTTRPLPPRSRTVPARRDEELAAVLRRGRLLADRRAVAAAIPADPSEEIHAAEIALADLRRRREELAQRRGRYAFHPVAKALLERDSAEATVARLQGNLADRRLPRKERRDIERRLTEARSHVNSTSTEVADLARPELARIGNAEDRLTARLDVLRERRVERETWLDAHPEALPRLERLDAAVSAIDKQFALDRGAVEHARQIEAAAPSMQRIAAVAERSVGLDVDL